MLQQGRAHPRKSIGMWGRDISLRRYEEEFITRSELMLVDSKESLGKAGTCPRLGAVRTQGQFGRSLIPFIWIAKGFRLGKSCQLVKKL